MADCRNENEMTQEGLCHSTSHSSSNLPIVPRGEMASWVSSYSTPLFERMTFIYMLLKALLIR